LILEFSELSVSFVKALELLIVMPIVKIILTILQFICFLAEIASTSFDQTLFAPDISLFQNKYLTD